MDTAIDFFGAHTATFHLDVRDRVAILIIDVRSVDGSTVRFYNTADEEFMTLKSDRVSKQFQPLFHEALVGVRHADDGRPYTDGEADELL